MGADQPNQMGRVSIELLGKEVAALNNQEHQLSQYPKKRD